MKQAQIREVFNSIQGEGIYVGARQVFVRFQDCNLHCNYCDTPLTRNKTANICKIEPKPVSGDFFEILNPVKLETLCSTIDDLWIPSTEHISLTGGEPLIQADFINCLYDKIEYPLYLETNSSLPDKAKIVKDSISIAACDIKLPEHCSSDDYDSLLSDELETIRIFYDSGVTTFVKIVILPVTDENSMKKAIDGLASISPDIPLVLQPVTFDPDVGPYIDNLVNLTEAAGEKIDIVRVIPQVHKFLRLL